MKAKFTVSTMWDSRVMHPKTKQSRVMLCIVLNRQPFKLSIKLYCTRDDYDKANTGRSLNVAQKNLKQEMHDFVVKAENVLERLAEPTKDSFLKFFKSDANLSTSSKIDVYALFKLKYDALMKEGRFGTAGSLRGAWRSFLAYKEELFIEDIDERFIKTYTAFMLKKSVSLTTIGMYLRSLRAIFYQAVNDGLISGVNKPFKSVALSSSVRSKSVIYPLQMEALWNYRSESLRDQRAIAFFFFCYLANGMNFKDVCHLKFKNIQGNVLSFTRQKTKRTKRNVVEIKVYLHDAMKKIIAVWGNKEHKPDNYIFALMPKYESDFHMDETINRYKRYSNKALAKIGKKLGFDVHLCLNLARHSYATKQKLDGTPISFISDAMGHSSMAVTEHYLKSLPDENLKALNAKLLNFK